MAYGSSVTQAIPNGKPPAYVGDSRDRDRLAAEYDRMIAARPKRPPPLRIEEHRESPGAVEARRAQASETASPVAAPRIHRVTEIG